MENKYTVMTEYPYTVEVFYNGSGVPGLSQPHWPNGEPWESSEEAELWAEQFIDSIENLESPYAPSGRGEPRLPKPDPETPEDLDEILDVDSDEVLEITE
jgi:hypothetical protein